LDYLGDKTKQKIKKKNSEATGHRKQNAENPQMAHSDRQHALVFFKFHFSMQYFIVL